MFYMAKFFYYEFHQWEVYEAFTGNYRDFPQIV